MKKKKLLLVEDDELMRTLYTDLLSESYEVVTATDGEEALKRIPDATITAVLLDMLLPKMNGVDVIMELQKSNPSALKKKIVFLTNMEGGPMIEHVKKFGYAYVTKSELNPEEFVKKIISLL